jgi:alpha-glucosidase/alpha-D-xyloside xylohydrolase
LIPAVSNSPDHDLSRRDAIKRLAAAGATLRVALDGAIAESNAPIVIAGQPVEIMVASLSPTTVRIRIAQIDNGRVAAVAYTGALANENPGEIRVRARDAGQLSRIRAGDLRVRYTENPPTIHVETSSGDVVQRLTLDAASAGLSFLLSDGPVLGMGEGGPQFDKKGTTDQMINGQGGYRLATHGTRAPVQWLIGTSQKPTSPHWALFIHQPYGTFDLTGTEGKFALPAPREPRQQPSSMVNPDPVVSRALPLDIFVVASRDPAVIMREYARITGLPEMPARWTFGYQQSHRTLDGPEQILGVAKTFREKKLPCDALIYLGTEFTPSGWNTRNGEFTWHPTNFPNPKEMMDTLHAQHFKVVMHIVIEGRRLTGTVKDPCTAETLPSGRTPDNRWPPDRQASCYWPVHKQLMDVGVDAWWPDQGDGLDGVSRLNRHRMYWEGTQLYRPNERPYALHRNASAGAQRYGGFIWSGDIQTRWETLKTHVPVAVNTGLSGLPYWGTDIGGFIPTNDYTGELHVRWFQFGAFNPLFRAHGRHWHLRLPWGWDGGDGGPMETNWRIDPAELNNKDVEPIIKKYLELRYRLMPYLYTAVRDCCETGMPIMRAMWLHFPDDTAAVARGDQYLWGRDILVAPVVEKGATSRALYLPRGAWYDFWTNERIAGGREISRPVDLATTPLYVRAGAVIPTGPVRQYVDEPSDEPLTLTVYPGADSRASLYDDDGKSFDYRRGAFMRMLMTWRDASRRLTLSLAPGSRMVPPVPRRIQVRVAGSSETSSVTFTGRSVDVQL